MFRGLWVDYCSSIICGTDELYARLGRSKMITTADTDKDPGTSQEPNPDRIVQVLLGRRSNAVLSDDN